MDTNPKEVWKEMPAEQLIKLYIQRPCNPALFRYVNEDRRDVVSLYETLRVLAGWR